MQRLPTVERVGFAVRAGLGEHVPRGGGGLLDRGEGAVPAEHRQRAAKVRGPGPSGCVLEKVDHERGREESVAPRSVSLIRAAEVEAGALQPIMLEIESGSRRIRHSHHPGPEQRHQTGMEVLAHLEDDGRLGGERRRDVLGDDRRIGVVRGEGAEVHHGRRRTDRAFHAGFVQDHRQRHLGEPRRRGHGSPVVERRGAGRNGTDEMHHVDIGLAAVFRHSHSARRVGSAGGELVVDHDVRSARRDRHGDRLTRRRSGRDQYVHDVVVEDHR